MENRGKFAEIKFKYPSGKFRLYVFPVVLANQKENEIIESLNAIQGDMGKENPPQISLSL